MPLFTISQNMLMPVEQTEFSSEKTLQTLIEKSLEAVFNCRLVASEFSTGTEHAGRIDTLALSEEDNPVIIEYKKVASAEIINQSLFYLSWIQDHRGDFEMAVQKSFDTAVKVDWSDIRVICIAPQYKKYDLHVVQVVGANIELWKYRQFANHSLYMEKVFPGTKTVMAATPQIKDKNPVMVEAGKKAARTKASEVYTFEEHLEGKSKQVQAVIHSIREYITGLDSAIEEIPRKSYVAYRASQNIVCMKTTGGNIKLGIKLKPSDVTEPPKNYRDVSKIIPWGIGDVEFTISSQEEFEEIKKYIQIAYNKVGG